MLQKYFFPHNFLCQCILDETLFATLWMLKWWIMFGPLSSCSSVCQQMDSPTYVNVNVQNSKISWVLQQLFDFSFNIIERPQYSSLRSFCLIMMNYSFFLSQLGPILCLVVLLLLLLFTCSSKYFRLNLCLIPLWIISNETISMGIFHNIQTNLNPEIGWKYRFKQF